jgi:hypothetical protein
MVNLLPFALAWVVLLIAVIALAFMRKNVSAQEDDSIHLGGGAEIAVARQEETAKKLAKLDSWGKILTTVMAVSGVLLVIVYLWQMWESSSRAGM